MQTKFAVGVQNLDHERYLEQLQSNIDELPDAAGADAAFVALIGDDQPVPSPSTFQASFGPSAGQFGRRPFSSEMPSRFGPRNWGQSPAVRSAGRSSR